MVTNQKVKTQFTLPELQDSKLIEWDWHVVENLGAHDAIIGRDIMEFLGIDIRFSDQTVEWDGASMPFKEGDSTMQDAYHVPDPGILEDASTRLKKILDAKYEAADLEQLCGEQDQLSPEEQQQLLTLLKKHESLFDGTLGKWT